MQEQTPRSRPLPGPASVDECTREIFKTSLDALLLVDDDRRYLLVNQPTERMFGIDASGILGRRIDDFTPAQDHPRLEQLWSLLRRRGELEGQYTVRRADGTLQLASFRARWSFGPGTHLIAAKTVDAPADAPGPPRPEETLTPREREILSLVATGASNEQIAEELFVSPATIKTHLQHTYKKLSVGDRAAAVAQAIRQGVIT